jgi:2-furoyl-CoA dehydrogenase 2Fe-2S iron sulfur subunit
MPRLSAQVLHDVRFTLNGKPARLAAEPRLLATDALRHRAGLTGTHVGCEHGVCGACTILIDGVPARACLTLAVQLEGCDVRTVEGLAPAPDRLSVLQEAFRRHHALHCGFCTAGILMSVDAFLKETPDPQAHHVREVVGGHLCRCTGYTAIVAAVLDAAATLRGEESNV